LFDVPQVFCELILPTIISKHREWFDRDSFFHLFIVCQFILKFIIPLMLSIFLNIYEHVFH
jgi:hypothetical protein